MLMSWGFMVLAFLIALGLVIRVARAQAKKTRMRLEALAQRTGLRIVESTVLGFTVVKSLEGERQGRAVRFWTYATGSGKTRITWVAVSVRPQPAGGLEFELTRQNFGSKLMELFGAKEIQVGDPAFDRAWYVRTNQADFFRAALVPQIRARLMGEAAGRRGARYKLKDGLVQYVEQGSWSSGGALERLEQQLPLLHELADVAEVFAASSH